MVALIAGNVLAETGNGQIRLHLGRHADAEKDLYFSYPFGGLRLMRVSSRSACTLTRDLQQF